MNMEARLVWAILVLICLIIIVFALGHLAWGW
jgi:hypothetical protein